MGRNSGSANRRMCRGAFGAQRATDAATVGLAALFRGGLISRFCRDRSGNYVIISGLLMPVLVGSAGLGTEVGLWFYKHQTVQSAADSGAISAATAYYVQGNASN